MRRSNAHRGPVLVDSSVVGAVEAADREPGVPVEPTWGVQTPAAIVVVVGPPGRSGHLAEFLPANWQLRWAGSVGDLGNPELVLITGATGALVATARERCPDAVVLAAVSADAPSQVVVDVLRAGADGCVRSDHGPIVAAHLRACQRRHARGRRAGDAVAEGVPIAAVSA